MTDKQNTTMFEGEVQHALQYLYNPAELRKNALLSLINLPEGHSPLTALRQMLNTAIESLKPATNVPLNAQTWRTYRILTYRYVERLSQREVANDLSLSVRQLRRDEHAAIRVLADQLKHRYALDPGLLAVSKTYTVAETPPDRQQELDWLTRTVPSTTTEAANLVEAVLHTIAPLLTTASVEVTSHIPPGLPPVVGQLAMIQQALLNVLTLAVHMIPAGQIHILVEESQEYMNFRIQAGIGEAGSPHRIEDWIEGLAISRQLVEMSGGTLHIAGAPAPYVWGVTLSLPAVKQEHVSVLIIDDNTDTLTLYQRYLSGSQYQFTGISNPEEVLQRAGEVSPQIIIVDVMLPVTDGWELLGRLRENPQTRAIPIIVCTILPQEKLALALGAAGFLQKPVSRNTLLAELARLRSD